MDAGFAQNATDRNLKAGLSAGAVDRAIGDGLTFVASAVSARQGIGTWILRFRFGGRQRKKVLGRYPAVSLKQARELARKDRALLQQGINVAAEKQQEKLKAEQTQTVQSLSEAWYGRHILGKPKHPEVVERLIRHHIKPVIGKLLIEEVRPSHIDRVLTRIVDAGAPTVAAREHRVDRPSNAGCDGQVACGRERMQAFLRASQVDGHIDDPRSLP